MASPAPPQPFRWDGEAMQPLRPRAADRQYVIGQVYTLEETEERSPAAHRSYFAAVNECWKSLPEAMASDHPTADALRKHALIATGWRDQETHVCGSKAEALRTASLIKRYAPSDAWPVITVANCVVVVLTAKSQAVRAMPKGEFEQSSRDVLAYLADRLGVSPASIPSHEAA